jgi:hypothetical protein
MRCQFSKRSSVLWLIAQQQVRHPPSLVSLCDVRQHLLGHGLAVGHNHLRHEGGLKIFNAAFGRFQLGLDRQCQRPPALPTRLFPRACDRAATGLPLLTGGGFGEVTYLRQGQDKANVCTQ